MDNLEGAVGVMTGLTVWVACTLCGGVVSRCLSETVGGGISVRIVSWHDAWRIVRFTGRILAGMMVGGALGLQLLATTVSSSLSSLERMLNGLLLRVWH
jgi:hypothetical protein